MSDQESVKIVQNIYAAFKRNDVPSITDQLADDVYWQSYGPRTIPWCGIRRGRQQVALFFNEKHQTVEINQYEPQRIIAQREEVVVLGYEWMRIRSTGQTYETDWAHIWTLRAGKVVEFREYSDTAAVMAAFKSA